MSAALLILFVLGLAGLPPTAGLYGRYLLFHALVETGHRYVAWAAAVVAFRFGLCVFANRSESVANRAGYEGFGSQRKQMPPLRLARRRPFVLGISVFVCVAAGLYSEPFARMARYAFGK